MAVEMKGESVARGGFPIHPLTDFLQFKSVLPTFRFIGYFEQGKIKGSKFATKSLNDIKSYHIRSVSYEQHTFKQEGQYHGPGILKTFPVLDRAENGAYRLAIVFEEDRFGTILKFIEYLKSKIINTDGLYNSISEMKNLEFHLDILTEPNYTIIFRNVYFQTAEANDYSYGESDMKTYTVTFAYENYEIVESMLQQSDL